MTAIGYARVVVCVDATALTIMASKAISMTSKVISASTGVCATIVSIAIYHASINIVSVSNSAYCVEATMTAATFIMTSTVSCIWNSTNLASSKGSGTFMISN